MSVSLRIIRRFFEKMNSVPWEELGSPAYYRLDYLYCRIRYGFNLDQYLANEIYRLRGAERKKYLSTTESSRLARRIYRNSSKEEIRSIGNKYLFEKTYRRFVHRAFLSTAEATGEEIRQFLEKHGEVLKKELASSMGRGIEKIRFSPDTADRLVASLKEGDYILEEIIVQHHEMSALNPSSVNTVRIGTVLDHARKPRIVGACLRIGGKDRYVDNFHSGGVAYPIDVDTGVVCGKGSGLRTIAKVSCHPSTGKSVIGFQIPNWEQAKQTVLAAAIQSENMVFLGWDVAITEDGVELIEANNAQDPTVLQLDQVGKRALILNAIR